MRWLETALSSVDNLSSIAVEQMTSDGPSPVQHTYGSVLGSACRLANDLDARVGDRGTGTIGILTGNGVHGVVADVALLLTELSSVPIPLAFNKDQARHLLSTAVVCLVDEQGARRLEKWGGAAAILPPGCEIVRVEVSGDHDRDTIAARVKQAAGYSSERICKIVHTSGTTSTPKGVMLRRGAVDDLITSITHRVGVEAWQRYVSVVPLSLLVEQVFAVYLTFLAGGTVVFLPEETKPLGTAGSSVDEVCDLLPAARATVSLVPPSLVEGIAARLPKLEGEASRSLSLALYGREDPMMLFSGGAPVSSEVLRVMWDKGLPVYVAYGLSENGSVATLNAPGQVELGTVGRPLRHCQVRCADTGELLIKSSSLLSGYLGSADPTALPVDEDGWLHTGDIATIDELGYVTITGRMKNVIITSNGRNVSPEWVEAQYKSMPSIESAVVFGDNLERLVGLFVLKRSASPAAALEEIRTVNEDVLSEIERVSGAALVTSEESFYSEFYTVTGRPRRNFIWSAISDGRFSLAEV